jgi:hypothetical protein
MVALTKPIPKHIKQNFFYRKIYRDIFQKKKNAGVIAVGQVGSGKSCGCLKMAEDLDPGFDSSRIVFSVEDFLALIKSKKLKRGSCIVFDEVSASEKGADSRNAMSGTNKKLSYIISCYRSRGYILLITTPTLNQLDLRARTIAVSAILKFKGVDFEKKRGVADLHWVVLNAMTGKTYLPKPRIKSKATSEVFKINEVLLPLPSPKLLNEYEEKKETFLQENFERWHSQFAGSVKKGCIPDKIPFPEMFEKAKQMIKELVVQKKGKWVAEAGLIRAKFDTGEVVARDLRRALNAEIASGKVKIV